MASLSSTGNYYFHSKNMTPRIRQVLGNSTARNLVVVSCHGREPNNDDSSNGLRRRKEENEGQEMFPTPNFFRFDKLAEPLKESLSPKRKGDWKDLTLMSLSFAVYIYISQRIVSAYFIWMSMSRPQW